MYKLRSRPAFSRCLYLSPPLSPPLHCWLSRTLSRVISPDVSGSPVSGSPKPSHSFSRSLVLSRFLSLFLALIRAHIYTLSFPIYTKHAHKLMHAHTCVHTVWKMRDRKGTCVCVRTCVLVNSLCMRMHVRMHKTDVC